MVHGVLGMSLRERAIITDRIRPLAIRLISPFIVLLLWEIMVRVNLLDYRFFPAPSSVVLTFIELTLSGEMLLHVQASLQRLFFGFLIGSALGLFIGLAMGWSEFADQLIDPLIAVFYPIPKLALLPLILIIFGIGEASKIAIVSTAVFFTVVINTAAAVRTIEPVVLDAARSYGAKGVDMFLKVVIPAALPTIFTGLRLGLGLGLVVIIAAEFVASDQGLGYLVWLSWGSLSTSKMYAGLITIGLVGLVTTYALEWIADRSTPWNVEKQEQRRQSVETARPRRFQPLKHLKRIPKIFGSYSRHYLYEFTSVPGASRSRPPGEDIWFEIINESNVELIQEWKGWWRARSFRKNLARKMTGVYALSHGRVVGYVWGMVKKGNRVVCCSSLPIEVGDGVIRQTEVRKEYQQPDLGIWLREVLLKHLSENDAEAQARPIYEAVRVENTPVQKLLERLGSDRSKQFHLFRLSPWIFLYRSWQLEGEDKRIAGSGKWQLTVKVPGLVFDPLIQRIVGRKISSADKAWELS